MRKIFLLASIAMLTFSCEKSDDNDNTVSGASGATVNEYRVKSISGASANGEEFVFTFEYESDIMTEVQKYDRADVASREIIGDINIMYGYSQTEVRYNDKPTFLHPEQIAQYKKDYPESYLDSLNNYRDDETVIAYIKDMNQSMEESSPRNQNISIDEEGRVIFIGYNTAHTTEDLFEYDNNGYLIAIRQFYSIAHNDGNSVTYERVNLKYEYDYQDGRIVQARLLTAKGGTSWIPIDTYAYAYQGSDLMSVEGEHYTLKREGNTVTCRVLKELISDETLGVYFADCNKETVYTLNSNGYATNVVYHDGSTATIDYEKGNGNYNEVLSTKRRDAFGENYIK